jgi:hypothetical protein
MENDQTMDGMVPSSKWIPLNSTITVVSPLCYKLYRVYFLYCSDKVFIYFYLSVLFVDCYLISTRSYFAEHRTGYRPVLLHNRHTTTISFHRLIQ